MRRFLILALMLLQIAAFAQVTPPAAVTKAFKAKYPVANDLSWTNVDDNYLADFYDSDYYRQTASFDAQGNCIETGQSIYEEDLPQEVTTAVTKYNGYINSSLKVTLKDGTVVYDLQVENDEYNYDLRLDANGKILAEKKTKIVYEDEEGDDDWE